MGLGPCFGGLAAAIASTRLLRIEVGAATVLIAFATCAAVVFFAVVDYNKWKRLNATPKDNRVLAAFGERLQADLIEIRSDYAWGQEVDKSTFKRLQYWRLARLGVPAFAILYFLGRAATTIDVETGMGDAGLFLFWAGIIVTAVALAVLKRRAGSEENRFQGKKPLALDGFEKENAAEAESFERREGDGETFDEPAADDSASWGTTRFDASWPNAAAKTGRGEPAAEKADLAARWA